MRVHGLIHFYKYDEIKERSNNKIENEDSVQYVMSVVDTLNGNDMKCNDLRGNVTATALIKRVL